MLLDGAEHVLYLVESILQLILPLIATDVIALHALILIIEAIKVVLLIIVELLLSLMLLPAIVHNI